MDTYELVDRKTVPDSNGFITDYSWYVNTETGEQVMVFGDSELYTPEDGYFDAEFDNEDEAQEWFDAYNGIEDESLDRTVYTKKTTIKANESTEPPQKKASRFMYKGYICAKCEDGFRIYTTQEWQYGKDLRLSEATVADEDAAKKWIDDALEGGTGIYDVDTEGMKDVKESRSIKKEAYEDQWVQSYGVDILYKEGTEDVEDRIGRILTKEGFKVLGVMYNESWDIDEYKKVTGVNALESKKVSRRSRKTEGWSSDDMLDEINDALDKIWRKWGNYLGDLETFQDILSSQAEYIWDSVEGANANYDEDNISESVKKEAISSNNLEDELFESLDTIYNKWDHYFDDQAEWAETVGIAADRVWEAENELDECTNSSSVGQHKKDSIDLIDEAVSSNHPDKMVLDAVVNALKNANIKFEFRGPQKDEILVRKEDLEQASEIRNKLDPNYTVTVMCRI